LGDPKAASDATSSPDNSKTISDRGWALSVGSKSEHPRPGGTMFAPGWV